MHKTATQIPCVLKDLSHHSIPNFSKGMMCLLNDLSTDCNSIFYPPKNGCIVRKTCKALCHNPSPTSSLKSVLNSALYCACAVSNCGSNARSNSMLAWKHKE